MLVPSEDSNMDRERLASAHRTEGVVAAGVSARPATIGFNMNSIFRRLLKRSCGRRSPRPDMAERAAFTLYSCVWRHIRVKRCYRPSMPRPDLNLLVTLDVLLAEGSVARAAQ